MLVVLIALSVSYVRLSPAVAMTFACIESSKYKYLLKKLFSDDPKQLSLCAWGRSDQSASTRCVPRRVLATGGTTPGDSQRLIAIIAQNKGWLGTLYLNSGGGDVAPATRNAMVVRDFWLGTKVMPGGGSFIYEPDFIDSSNASLAPRRATFDATVRALATPEPTPALCASACTFILAAGVDREGVARAHRCGVGGDTFRPLANPLHIAWR